jgi:protein O-GlcNAc transferase
MESHVLSSNLPSDAHQAEQPLIELAVALSDQGDLTGAVEAYEQAVRLAPHRADLFVDMGGLLQALNRPAFALEAYQRAISADPDFIPARQNLGYLLCNLGEPEQALKHYEHALQVRPSPMTYALAATVLPAVYDSIEEVHQWRSRFASRVQVLAKEGLRVETLRSQIPTNFYLAYQGYNDREIAQQLGRIYRGHELCRPANDHPLEPREGRLRIGFLSAFFRDHTIGRLNLGIVRHLSRTKFEVTVLSLASSGDELADLFAQAADQYLVVPQNVEVARQFVAAQGLDVLIFADVGMDAITSTLAYSRMAPVQCASWGHPDTTGSPTIDYYLSSTLLETSEADAHYTERLVRLPQMGV